MEPHWSCMIVWAYVALIQYDMALASTSKTSGLGLGLNCVVLEHIPGHFADIVRCVVFCNIYLI